MINQIVRLRDREKLVQIHHLDKYNVQRNNFKQEID